MFHLSSSSSSSFLALLLLTTTPSLLGQRFECMERGSRCMGHISGFAKDVVSYEECAFRCR